MHIDANIAEFQDRLRETMAWCARRASLVEPATSLRSPELRPQNICKVPSFITLWARRQTYDFTQPTTEADWAIIELETQPRIVAEREAVVSALATERAKLLRGDPVVQSSSPRHDMLIGRVLAYAPDDNDASEASGGITAGFFAYDDEPPWDTWLMYIDEPVANKGWTSYLLSWVPGPLLAVAEVGIDVNGMDCLACATDLESVFVHRLRAARLLPEQ